MITNENGQRKTVFNFNKDAGMFVCPAGHMAIRKARTGNKDQGRNQVTTFLFDIGKM